MRLSCCAVLVQFVFGFGGESVEARETLSAAGMPRTALQTSTPVSKDTYTERKAVRGIALEGVGASEAPELRAMRQFEEQAFPRNGAFSLPDVSPDDQAKPLPAGLTGRWGGSGDIPRTLQSPEQRSTQPLPKPGVGWLRDLVPTEIPVRWEPQVVRYLEFFKDDPKGHSIMAAWLRRMGRYRAVIERALEGQELPKDLIYLAMIESGFDPGATSIKSAGGLWQFIPGAARAYGLEVSHWVDARRDPERAAEAAARLLKDLYVRFGSWHLAFAAYNAGYGAVLRSIARFNTNDFWELARHEAGLPWETTLYVPKILAASVVGHNLKAFGFANVVQDPPWEFERVEVPAGTSFAVLARAAGTRPDVMEDLNPEFVSGRIPPDRGPIVLRVPVGSAGLFAKAAAEVRANGEHLMPVVLRFGETLEDVAKARSVSLRELKRINGVVDSGEIRSGMTILVPARASSVVPAPAAEESDDTILVAVPDRAFAYQGRERVFYRTRDGDTLAEIATVFDVTPDNIVEWNNIDADAKLQPKLILQLFVHEGLDFSNIVLLDPDKVRVVTLGSEEFLELEAARRGKTRLFYAARAGDTLAKIAKRYGLAPGDLARVNRLSTISELTEGQRVVVYSPTPELPKEITAKVTGVAKKPTLAMKEGTAKNARDGGVHHLTSGSTSSPKSPTAKPVPRSAAVSKSGGKATASTKQQVAAKNKPVGGKR